MITSADLAAFRDLAKDFFTTVSIEIYSSSDKTDAPSAHTWDDSIKTYPTTPTATVDGWVRSRPNADVDEDEAAIINEEETRLFVEVGTAIEKGDKVVFGGKSFSVIDTNADNTYLILLRVSLRRVE